MKETDVPRSAELIEAIKSSARFRLIYESNDPSVLRRNVGDDFRKDHNCIYLACASSIALQERRNSVEAQRRLFRLIIRDAKSRGLSRNIRRILFDLLQPRGSTNWQLHVQPRPASPLSMPKLRAQQLRLSKTNRFNSYVAGEILRLCESGMRVIEAAEQLGENRTFNLSQSSLLSRWHAWRRLGRLGSEKTPKSSGYDLEYDNFIKCYRARHVHGLGQRGKLPSSNGGRPRKRR